MNKNQKTWTKQELADEVWNRVKKILDERKISQVELVKLCESHGYKVKQPEISKLFSGMLKINLYHLTAFSSALGVSTDYLINETEEFHRLHVEGEAFITSPDNDAFNGYMGIYHTIFKSTSPFENRILRGTMEFRPSENGDICEALFLLDTGKVDSKGQKRIKRYQGQLLISSRMNVAYCILVNESIGEISMVEFRHRSFLIEQAECRQGLVLTVAAGEIKEPIVHRLFLSRERQSEEQLQKIIPFMKVEPNQVIISKSVLQNIRDETDFDFSKLAYNCETDEMIFVEEADVRKVKKGLSRTEIAHILCTIKSETEGLYVHRLSEADDSLTYEMLRK